MASVSRETLFTVTTFHFLWWKDDRKEKTKNVGEEAESCNLASGCVIWANSSKKGRYVPCPWLQQVSLQGDLHLNYWGGHHVHAIPCIRYLFLSVMTSKNGIKLVFFAFLCSSPNTLLFFSDVAYVMAGLGCRQGLHPEPQGEILSQLNPKKKFITSKVVADPKLQVKSSHSRRKTEGVCQHALLQCLWKTNKQMNKTPQLAFLWTVGNCVVNSLSWAAGKLC